MVLLSSERQIVLVRTVFSRTGLSKASPEFAGQERYATGSTDKAPEVAVVSATIELPIRIFQYKTEEEEEEEEEEGDDDDDGDDKDFPA